MFCSKIFYIKKQLILLNKNKPISKRPGKKDKRRQLANKTFS